MSGVTLRWISETADRLFPFALAESWDNCGIQVGDPDGLVTGIVFCLDPSPTTVRYASRQGCNLLVCHHPLILEPLRSIRTDSYVGRVVLEAAASGTAILSLYTNLDAGPGGLNDRLTELTGLKNVITPEGAACARIGELQAPMSLGALALKTAADLGLPTVRTVGPHHREVLKVFLAAGSGMGYMGAAVRSGCDVMLTGDVRYHAAHEALELGMPVIDAGHFGLEKQAPALLEERFSGEFERLGVVVKCVVCDIEPDPFQTLCEKPRRSAS
ncbi:MAG: Nif3-like dinuclear metal center hexameric protein [Pseudomonadota bacterium]